MSYTFELNNERKDANFVSGKINGKSAVVEIFSAMVVYGFLSYENGEVSIPNKEVGEFLVGIGYDKKTKKHRCEMEEVFQTV